MEKYEKLFKGLETCAGPDCSTDCPYYGESRGGKTCRVLLLHDAVAALATEEGAREEAEAERDALREDLEEIAEELGVVCDRPAKKPEPGLAETMECALKATMKAEYWRGQADALKWFIQGDRVEYGPEDCDIELPDLEPLEAEDDGHV